MNKIIRIMLPSFAILIMITVGIVMRYNAHATRVQVYIGDSFVIPHDCRHIALLGCTPNPTNYLNECIGSKSEVLQRITLNDFLDLDYVRDSFNRTFALCKEYNIDHLIIAYLPIYYIEMRQLLGDQFVYSCRCFLGNIINDIAALMKQAAHNIGYDGAITLIIPPDYQLARVPQKLEGFDERIRYLIKQFPVLKNIAGSSLETITIINNKQSAEDDRLIDYLKYEYLYEKPIIFKKCNTGKERFHADKKKI